MVTKETCPARWEVGVWQMVTFQQRDLSTEIAKEVKIYEAS